ncbi:DUF3999 family protein [Persicobacter sp. CCB-QB2]|uniref:DUF3999 family protein n=1 Tax=Persicobacter sp. CCB-QB2 TaxID=1561025 RepID=UPI0006A97D1B|nr:DUF3999 family protein [Persicobacter sp. CCB-QB2]
MNKLLWLLLLIGSPIITEAQADNEYAYRRPLSEVKDVWHKISIPNEMFSQLNGDLSDLRILGRTLADTLEVPYILKKLEGQSRKLMVDFKLINQVKKEGIYFYTFKLNEGRSLNRIELDFGQQNFDWKIQLAGSYDQQEWFEILADYRILSLHNDAADFKFSRLNFPESEFTYYRVAIKSATDPLFQKARLWQAKFDPGTYRKYSFLTQEVETEWKRTVIRLNLAGELPVSKLEIPVHSEYDYYRKFVVMCASDSFKTAKGWRWNFRPVYNGVLTSVRKNEFDFESVRAKKVKIHIENEDNAPLSIGQVSLEGPAYILLARFIEEADYFLYYGNKKAIFPRYDIHRFSANIPKEVIALNLGEEEKLTSQSPDEKSNGLSDYWFWGVMVLIILLLGGFTLSMLKEKQATEADGNSFN